MGRKNDIKRKNVMYDSSTSELKKLSTILFSVVGIICVFYIITVMVVKNTGGLKYHINDEISQISYTDILASDILKKGGSYYVLVKDNKDNYMELYNTYLSSYNELDVYYVDLDDAFNKKYKALKTDLSKLEFKGTTLLKISNGEIELSFEDKQDIINHLKTIIAQ